MKWCDNTINKNSDIDKKVIAVLIEKVIFWMTQYNSNLNNSEQFVDVPTHDELLQNIYKQFLK